MLAACSPSPNSNPPGEPTAKATPTSYTTITWDKLMPEGAYEALDQEQAEYIGVKPEGPYKPEHYRY